MKRRTGTKSLRTLLLGHTQKSEVGIHNGGETQMSHSQTVNPAQKEGKGKKGTGRSEHCLMIDRGSEDTGDSLSLRYQKTESTRKSHVSCRQSYTPRSTVTDPADPSTPTLQPVC